MLKTKLIYLLIAAILVSLLLVSQLSTTAPTSPFNPNYDKAKLDAEAERMHTHKPYGTTPPTPNLYDSKR